ncbi:MAG: hypothetical protein WAL40_10195 [Rhodoplanes sp.]
MMMDSRSAAQAVAYSAIENVRPYEVTRGELITALSSGAGDPTLVRTLFGDVSLLTILQLAIEFGISDPDLAQAYARARRICGARNPELDEFAAEFGHELDFGGPRHRVQFKAD